jgi:hypothetical protein
VSRFEAFLPGTRPLQPLTADLWESESSGEETSEESASDTDSSEHESTVIGTMTSNSTLVDLVPDVPVSFTNLRTGRLYIVSLRVLDPVELLFRKLYSTLWMRWAGDRNI